MRKEFKKYFKESESDLRKQIKKLQNGNAILKRQNDLSSEMINDYRKETEVLRKALELACKNLFDFNNEKYNYFIEQAKESMK